MKTAVFNRFREIIYECSGITLGSHKLALLSARLGKRIRALQLPGYDEYLEYLTQDRTGTELILLLDAVSTNLTSFYREPVHFELLGKLAAEWLEKGQKRMRIWSSACSTGEEPYTMAMTLATLAEQYGADVKILATDISTQVLARARAGIYDGSRVKQIPPMQRHAAFSPAPEAGVGCQEIAPHLKAMVLFRRLNLVETPYQLKGPMDIIFCRNVMIYFDNTVRELLLSEFHRLLKPGGYLLVGHSESLTNCKHSFSSVKPSVYRKQP